jgi:sortase A
MNRLRKYRKNIGFGLLFLIGLSILLYPTVSNLWNEYRAQQLINEYNSTVSNDSGIDYEATIEAAKTYNQSLIGETLPDAFSIRDGIQDVEYESQLNISGTGMMGYVEIPSINVKIPIYHYTTEEVLEKGVGHLFGSSLPIGGESTHSVLTAHRGLPSAKLFTDLDLLENGDIFYIYVLDEILAYEVDQILTVEPEDTKALAIEEGKDYVTLITCTPYAVNSHRLLVRGHRISFVQSEYQKQKKETKSQSTTNIKMRILCVIAGIAIAFGLVFFINRRENRKKYDEKTKK